MYFDNVLGSECLYSIMDTYTQYLSWFCYLNLVHTSQLLYSTIESVARNPQEIQVPFILMVDLLTRNARNEEIETTRTREWHLLNQLHQRNYVISADVSGKSPSPLNPSSSSTSSSSSSSSSSKSKSKSKQSLSSWTKSLENQSTDSFQRNRPRKCQNNFAYDIESKISTIDNYNFYYAILQGSSNVTLGKFLAAQKEKQQHGPKVGKKDNSNNITETTLSPFSTPSLNIPSNILESTIAAELPISKTPLAKAPPRNVTIISEKSSKSSLENQSVKPQSTITTLPSTRDSKLKLEIQSDPHEVTKENSLLQAQWKSSFGKGSVTSHLPSAPSTVSSTERLSVNSQSTTVALVNSQQSSRSFSEPQSNSPNDAKETFTTSLALHRHSNFGCTECDPTHYDPQKFDLVMDYYDYIKGNFKSPLPFEIAQKILVELDKDTKDISIMIDRFRKLTETSLTMECNRKENGALDQDKESTLTQIASEIQTLEFASERNNNWVKLLANDVKLELFGDKLTFISQLSEQSNKENVVVNKIIRSLTFAA
eukprot:Awhi_evm1s3927